MPKLYNDIKHDSNGFPSTKAVSRKKAVSLEKNSKQRIISTKTNLFKNFYLKARLGRLFTILVIEINRRYLFY